MRTGKGGLPMRIAQRFYASHLLRAIDSEFLYRLPGASYFPTWATP